jgi:hypothetical protein
MTVNYKLDSVIELRKYLWDQLVDAEIFNPDDYYSENIGDAIIPIIPVQQSPEMNQFLSGKKHIIYDKVGISYDTMWQVCTEQVLFTLYATDFSDLNEIRNLMIDLFRRMDESAQDVNRWANISTKFKFFSIYVSDMSPISPSEEVQGFLAADVILEIKYARDISTSGRVI